MIRTDYLILFFCLFICWTCKEPPSQTTTTNESSSGEALEEVVESPPSKTYDYDTSQWVELVDLDTSFIIDLKYATTDNFVEEKLYDCPRCFLRPKAALALQKAHEVMKEKGFRFKLLDCYRPRPIQQKLWDKVPNASYVTPPSKGSMHNRGLAVDLTIVDASGNELDMGTPYDFFGREAHHTHLDHPQEVLDNRTLLKKTMQAFSFAPIRTEWWHYSYKKDRQTLSDMLWNCD